MKKIIEVFCVICFSCFVLNGQDDSFGRQKTEVAVSAQPDITNPAPQDIGKSCSSSEKVLGLKYRLESDALLKKLGVENREATPDELYIIARGLCFSTDGSKLEYKDLIRLGIPDNYERSARGGNFEALIFLLQFYGLGSAEIDGVGSFDGLIVDSVRFSELYTLKSDRFSFFEIPDKYQNLRAALKKESDRLKETQPTDSHYPKADVTKIAVDTEATTPKQTQDLVTPTVVASVQTEANITASTIREQVENATKLDTDKFIDKLTAGYWTPLNENLSVWKKIICWVVSFPIGVIGILFGWFVFPWCIAPIKLLLQAPLEIFIDRVLGALILGWCGFVLAYVSLGLKLL